MFSRLFGEKRPTIGQGQGGPKPPREQAETLVALEKLQAAADAMLKKKEFYEKRAENEVTRAKECLRSNNKSGATLALRRKKMLVSKVDGLEKSYFQLQEQILELESMQTTTEMLAAMKHAATAQKKVLAKHKVDNVDKVVEDLEDNKMTMIEIQESLAAGTSTEYDETELEEELAALEAEEMEGELLEKPRVGGVVRGQTAVAQPDRDTDLVDDLPAVPTARPNVANEKNTDKEVDELLASLNVA